MQGEYQWVFIYGFLGVWLLEGSAWKVLGNLHLARDTAAGVKLTSPGKLYTLPHGAYIRFLFRKQWNWLVFFRLTAVANLKLFLQKDPR